MNRFLCVSEIMSVRLLAVGSETTVDEAAQKMRSRGVGSVLVTEGPRLLGIVTERDFVTAVAERLEFSTPVARIMTDKVVTVDPESDIVYAARTMADRGIRHLPVAQEGNLVGMVSIRDIVRWGLMAIAWGETDDEAKAAFHVLGGGVPLPG